MTSLRDLMPALANKTYFNYGGQGPLPTPSLEAMTATWELIQRLGPFTGEVWPELDRLSGRLRRRLAHWFGVGPHRVAFSENVSAGCVLPLWGLPWRAGDELLISDAEHPGVVAACRELARRQHLGIADLPVQQDLGDQASSDSAVLERMERHLSPRTRLVVLSHLLWNTGQLMPIRAVAERLKAHPNQPWLLVDAAQSLGSIPLEGPDSAAAAADIYGCTGHKWCCGPEGLGAVVLSERLLQDSRPTLIGWRSLSDELSADSRFHGDARRFEVATSCTPLAAGLDRSLQLLEGEGDGASRLLGIRERSQQLWQGLQQLGGAQPLLTAPPPAGLVSFRLGTHAPAAVVEALGKRGIWLRTLAEPDCVRACTHLTTTAEEVEQLLANLADLIRSAG